MPVLASHRTRTRHKRTELPDSLAASRSCVRAVRIPREVGLHRVEQVEMVRVVGGFTAGDAHHQHEVHEAVCRVARIAEVVEADAGKRGIDVTARNPVDGPAVELRVRSMRAELARPAELEREMPGADRGHADIPRVSLDEVPQQATDLYEPPRLRHGRAEHVR